MSNLILLEFEFLKNVCRNSFALLSNLSYRPKNTDKYNISIDDLRFWIQPKSLTVNFFSDVVFSAKINEYTIHKKKLCESD